MSGTTYSVEDQKGGGSLSGGNEAGAVPPSGNKALTDATGARMFLIDSQMPCFGIVTILGWHFCQTVRV